MTTSLSPRIDQDIREVIDDLAHPDSTIDDVAEELIRIGIVVRDANKEPVIEGPLGLPRPYAEISLSKSKTEIRTSVEEEVADELTKKFDNKKNTAAREALRLGVLTVAGGEFTVKGPVGGPRPFAQIEIAENQDIYTTVEKFKNKLN